MYIYKLFVKFLTTFVTTCYTLFILYIYIYVHCNLKKKLTDLSTDTSNIFVLERIVGKERDVFVSKEA